MVVVEGGRKGQKMGDLEVMGLAEGVSAPTWPMGSASTGCCIAAGTLCVCLRGFGVQV